MGLSVIPFLRALAPGLPAVAALFLSAARADALPGERVLFERLFPEQRVVSEGERPSIDLHIEFAPGSAALGTLARAQLDVLGRVLTGPRARETRIAIHGHTDASGPRALNLRLSRRRAEAVKTYLADRFAIPPGRLETAGWGPDRPKVPRRPLDPANRRVEVINLTPLAAPGSDGGAPDEGNRPGPAGGLLK